MPVITRALNHGRAEVDVELNVTAALAQQLQKADKSIPTFWQGTALIDTGAPCTCIDKSLIPGLQLRPVGTRPVRSPLTGPTLVSATTYNLKLTVLHPDGHQDDLVVPSLEVTELDFTGMGHLFLIGTDVLLNYCHTFLYSAHRSEFSLRYD